MLPEAFGTKRASRTIGGLMYMPVRYTNTYAVLYNGDEVDIDEDDIRDYYDCSRITRELVSELSDDLHNEWIEYYEDEDGDYCLEGELSDYI